MKVVPHPWGWGPKKQEKIRPAWLMEALARRRPFRARVRTWASPSGSDILRLQGAVEWNDILIPCPGIEPGYPGWESGILARRLARARGWTLLFHGSLPPVKSAFITEAETVNAGTDFIIRNIAQVGEHRKKWFSWDRSKAEMQSWRESVWMSPLVSRSRVKSRASHLYEAVLLDFCLPSGLDPQEAFFFTCLVSLFSQKMREWRSLYPLLKQGFAALCPCHVCYFRYL